MAAFIPVKNIANGMLVGCFAAAICLPGWKTYRDTLALPRGQLIALATDPMWKVSRAFPGQFEPFFDERFGFRELLLDWLRKIKVHGLNVSSSPRVALGVDGWLYHLPMPSGADQQIVQPHSKETLQSWGRMLQARRDWLAERGIPYIVVIAPDKQSIYPEALPRGLRKRAGLESRLDQLLDHMRRNTNLTILDVRRPLRAAKDAEWLYAISDSHWNDFGAHIAYTEIVDELQRHFPEMAPRPRSEFEQALFTLPGGDCARMLGLSDHFVEVWPKLIPKAGARATRVEIPGAEAPLAILKPFATEVPDANLPRAVMFIDSFGGHVMSFLSEHFQRVVFAWERIDSPVFDSDLIERERPHVVIQQIVERKLSVYIPNGEATNDPRCESAVAWNRCAAHAD